MTDCTHAQLVLQGGPIHANDNPPQYRCRICNEFVCVTITPCVIGVHFGSPSALSARVANRVTDSKAAWLSARQATEELVESIANAEQWANSVANLIQLGAHEGESCSAELQRMEKVLLTYYPRAERSLAEVSADEVARLDKL